LAWLDDGPGEEWQDWQFADELKVALPQVGVVASKWQLTLVQVLNDGFVVCEKAEVALLYFVRAGELLRWDETLMLPSLWDGW
jgi:hypothetical protein